MKFQLLTIATILSTALALPSVEQINSRTSPTEVTCAQNTGIAACCKDNQKQKATSPAVLDMIGGILGSIPILSGLLIPITAQVGVAQQCSSIGVLAINPSFVKCEAVNVCCYNTNTNSPQSSSGLINLLNNNNIALCPQISLL